MGETIEIFSADTRFVSQSIELLRGSGFEATGFTSLGRSSERVGPRDLAILDIEFFSRLTAADRMMDSPDSLTLLVMPENAPPVSDLGSLAGGQSVVGCLYLPATPRQTLAAVASALQCASLIRRQETRVSNLQEALSQRRSVSIAIGLIMERLHVDRDEAFAILRQKARSRRRKVYEVAEDLLIAFDTLTMAGTASRPTATQK